MTKEQIEQKADMYIRDFYSTELSATDLILFAEQLISEATKELEEKISVLLSCKNCPENKGGFICQKEYEDKCLAQKIQYIKELQEEIAELKEKLEVVIALKDEEIGCIQTDFNTFKSKAKEIISEFMKYEINEYDGSLEIHFEELKKQAEQFLKDCEVEK